MRKSLAPGPPEECTLDLRRRIAFGTATSAFQVEGAWNASGRTPSVWDAFAHGEGAPNADVAADMYHHYKEDVRLMKRLGIKQYRFSISWNRLVPGARAGSPVSGAAVAFYGSLIDELLAAGITPFGTMMHLDLPESLHDAYQGPLSPLFADDFDYYAAAVLEHFGDRVKTWLTFQEPFLTCVRQYGTAIYPPSHRGGLHDVYRCGRNILHAHARARALMAGRFAEQGGRLGMGLHVNWPEPMSQSANDTWAARTMLDWQLGWLGDPLFLGRFPAGLKDMGGEELEPLTPAEAAALKGSADFFALQYYTSKFVGADDNTPLGFFVSDVDRAGRPIGERAAGDWQSVAPEGLLKLLRHIDARYARPEIVVTGNGVAVPGEYGEVVGRKQAAVDDAFRVAFYREHLARVCRAAAMGVRVTGFYAWSFLDNFEGLEGYSEQYGIVHVDFDSPTRNRTVKASALYLSEHFFKPGAGGGGGGGNVTNVTGVTGAGDAIGGGDAGGGGAGAKGTGGSGGAGASSSGEAGSNVGAAAGAGPQAGAAGFALAAASAGAAQAPQRPKPAAHQPASPAAAPPKAAFVQGQALALAPAGVGAGAPAAAARPAAALPERPVAGAASAGLAAQAAANATAAARRTLL